MGEIRADQKAMLSFKVADNSEKELDCHVKNIYTDRLSLRYPEETLSYAQYLEEGNEVPVKIFTPSGIKMYDAMILNSPLESEFVIEYVESAIQEIQRREYSRIQLKTKIIIEREDADNIVTQTVDIGGGGIRFVHNGVFHPDEKVSCRLYFPFEMASYFLQGQITKKPHLPANEHIMLLNRITEHDRGRIIRKCFEIEAMDYKKG